MGIEDTTESTETTEQTTEPVVEQTTEQQIADLEQLEKFQFKGKEWTADELEKAILMQSDYSRKTQELAQERKYYDNLPADLDMVRQNPSLAANFRQVYPEKFHGHLNAILGQAGAGRAGTQTIDRQGLDPLVVSRLDRVEQRFFEMDVKSKEAEIDSVFNKYQSKYPFAQESVVIAMAQAKLDKKETLDDKTWETLFKNAHQSTEKLFKEHQKNLIKQQTTANQKGRDVARGGGIPGQAPMVAKTLKEAQAIALQQLTGQ